MKKLIKPLLLAALMLVLMLIVGMRFTIPAGETAAVETESTPSPLAVQQPVHAMPVAVSETETTTEPEPEPETDWTLPAEYIAKTVYGEAGICSTTEQAAVIWCILNRTDSIDPFYPENIIAVITQPGQFCGYKEEHPVKPELYELALDVIDRWQREKDGEEDVGRVLPHEYLFFTGDGTHNYFRTDWRGGTAWDRSLPSPYEE